MNYKEQLKGIIRKFNTLKEELKGKITEVRESEKYAVDYKETLVANLKQEYHLLQEQLANEALEVITAAKNEWLKGKGSIEKNQAFDIKLSNTISILTTIGEDMTVEELQELVLPFKEDYHTMKILRKLFLKGGIKGVNEIFGIDNIDHNIVILDDLQRNISHVLSGDLEQANTLSLVIAIDMMSNVQGGI